MRSTTSYFPHCLVVALLMVVGPGVSIAQQPLTGQQTYSMAMMMDRMDSLMMEMHGMTRGGSQMMAGASMHGMLMGSSTATDSLTRAMSAMGSNMRDVMARMHELMGDQHFMHAEGHQEALGKIQRNMQTMMQSYQRMLNGMQTLTMTPNPRVGSTRR